MKTILALAMLAGLSQAALADKGGEGYICDINGCHQTSASEDFWNEWYIKQTGHSYDNGYRRAGDQEQGFGFTGDQYGYGGGTNTRYGKN